MTSRSLEGGCACDICSEEFNECDRRPRILTCGHSFCHSCLSKILQQQSSSLCPNCKADIRYLEPQLIPINYALENLISLAYDTPRDLQLEGHCEKHDTVKEFRCVDCKIFLCGDCRRLFHNRCSVKPLIEYNNDVKDKFCEAVNNELASREAKVVGLIDVLKLLEKERLSLIDIIRKKQIEFKNLEKKIGNFEQQIFDENKFCEKLKALQNLAEGCATYDAIVRAQDELDLMLESANKQTARLSLQLQQFSGTLESLKYLCQNEPVYAVVDVVFSLYGKGVSKEDRFYKNCSPDKTSDELSISSLTTLCKNEPFYTLYGKVAVKKSRAWISCFQTSIPQATLIPLEELLTSIRGFSKLPRRVFLKLCPDGGAEKESFEVEIETDGASKRGKNFIILCSGLRGLNYIGLSIKSGGCFSTKVYSLRPGPPPVVKGIKKGDRKTCTKDGCVYGMKDKDSRFGVSLFKSTGLIHEIGMITSGLNYLKKFSKMGKHLTIKDSGLVM